MSFVHLLLKKDSETKTAVEYLAVSPDFNEERNWKSVARIVIDKSARDYDFIPLNEWTNINLVSPKFYGLPERERETQLQGGAGCGAWTGRIHAWTMRLIKGNAYPSVFPS
jgi:hypothetical protein